MKNLIWVLLLLSSIEEAYSNCDSTSYYLKILNSELHLESEKMLLFEYLSIESRCRNHKVDSSALIRKLQPGYDLVIHCLFKISLCDQRDMEDSLLLIYDRYIDKFYEDWIQAYKMNYYACDLISKQFSILTQFEEALKNLKLKSYNDKAIFDNYINQSLLKYEMIKNIEKRCELAKNLDDVSKKYRAINPCSLYSGHVKFNYLDNYKAQLYTNFVDFMLNMNCNSDTGQYESDSCRVLFDNFDIIELKPNPKVIDFIYGNFDRWNQFNRSSLFYSYASKHYDECLSNFLIDKWIAETDSLRNTTFIKIAVMRKFWEDERNKKQTFDKLLKLIDSEFDKSIKLLQLILNEDINWNLSQDERKIDRIKQNLLKIEIKKE